LPFILKFFAKKVQKNFENQYKQQQGFQEENIKSDEGEIKVTIPKKPSKPKHDGSTGDEYIDFEEVEWKNLPQYFCLELVGQELLYYKP